jgi:RNA polymerase sigma-70 factor (ECF subfamily)
MTLSEDKREIIVMREFSCMTYTDIADALKIEEGTVKSRLSRARLALAEILKKDGTFLSSNTSNGQKGGRRRD